MRFLLPVPRVSWCHFRTIISTRARHESFKTSTFICTKSNGLTDGLSKHLSGVMTEYDSLLERANSSPPQNEDEHRKLYRSIIKLKPIVELVKRFKSKTSELEQLHQLSREDKDMKSLAMEEAELCQREIKHIKNTLIKAFIPRDEADQHSAILEVRAGAGGVEASIFAAEILQMYQRFAMYKKWAFEMLSVDRSDAGGYKHATAGLNGPGVFGVLKHEIGVHRVQRVPVTEGLGRIHTSTMSVVILPQPNEIEVKINPNDIKIDTMRASGAGGQHVNTTDSAIRLTHIPSGIVISIQDDRSQHKNRAKALKILQARLYEEQRRSATRERSEQRRQQMGTQERSEKIRTYNFPQDRVTDHRLGNTVYGVEEFLAGREMLDEVIVQLRANEEIKLIANLGVFSD